MYLKVNSQSGSGAMPKFEITKVWGYDSTTSGYTQSVPSDTDFLFVMACFINPTQNYSYAITVSPAAGDETLGYLFNKGDSVTLTKYYNITGNGSVTPTNVQYTVTWNSDNTISQTKVGTGGRIIILACKYIS